MTPDNNKVMTKEEWLHKTHINKKAWQHKEIMEAMQQYADQETKEKDKEIHFLNLQIKDLQEQINKRTGE